MTCVCAYSAYMKLNSQLYPECIIFIYYYIYYIFNCTMQIYKCSLSHIPSYHTMLPLGQCALLAKPKPCPYSSAVCVKNHPFVNCFGTALMKIIVLKASLFE